MSMALPPFVQFLELLVVFCCNQFALFRTECTPNFVQALPSRLVITKPSSFVRSNVSWKRKLVIKTQSVFAYIFEQLVFIHCKTTVDIFNLYFLRWYTLFRFKHDNVSEHFLVIVIINYQNIHYVINFPSSEYNKSALVEVSTTTMNYNTC